MGKDCIGKAREKNVDVTGGWNRACVKKKKKKYFTDKISEMELWRLKRNG